jgi:hypothetical protein
MKANRIPAFEMPGNTGNKKKIFIYDFTIIPSNLSTNIKELEKFYAEQIIDLKEVVELYDQACYELQINNDSYISQLKTIVFAMEKFRKNQKKIVKDNGIGVNLGKSKHSFISCLKSLSNYNHLTVSKYRDILASQDDFNIEQDVILIKKACYGVKQSAICKKVLRNGKIY